MTLHVVVFARNEERRIAAALASLPVERPDSVFHILVNGSHDRTAAVAREQSRGRDAVQVHDLAFGGKARSWNHYVDNILDEGVAAAVFMDGDVAVAPGAIDAMLATLEDNPQANAVAAAPSSGRRSAHYRAAIENEHGLFGGLYLLRGSFLHRLKRSSIRLPEDLIGDDGLIGALVKTDLHDESAWCDERVAFAHAAGFACERVALTRPATLAMQYHRMVSYSLRHFQNLVITAIMRGPGPVALPKRLADLYPDHLDSFRPRRRPAILLFDVIARRRIERLVAARRGRRNRSLPQADRI